MVFYVEYEVFDEFIVQWIWLIEYNEVYVGVGGCLYGKVYCGNVGEVVCIDVLQVEEQDVEFSE